MAVVPPERFEEKKEDDGKGVPCARPVIYVAPYLGLGGTEHHVLHLVRAIRWQAPPVVVAPDGELRKEFEAVGATVLAFPNPTGDWWRGLKGFRGALARALGRAFSAAESPGSGPPVVHVHGAAELLWLARRWAAGGNRPDHGRGSGARPRFLFTSHGYFGPGAATSYRVAAWLLRRTGTPVIAVSQQEAFRLRRFGLLPGQLQVIHNGVPDPLAEPEPAWPFGPGRPRVLSVGRLVQQKGMRELLLAFERVVPAFPQARLVIIGSGPLEAQLRAMVAGSPALRERVEMVGPVERAWRFMRHADVFCLPSIDEALPLGVIEALGSACAVVSTRAGGIPEIVDHGVSGLLVPPGDVEALTGALSQVMADEALRRRLGAEARRRFEARFTVDAMAARTVAVYERL